MVKHHLRMVPDSCPSVPDSLTLAPSVRIAKPYVGAQNNSISDKQHRHTVTHTPSSALVAAGLTHAPYAPTEHLSVGVPREPHLILTTTDRYHPQAPRS